MIARSGTATTTIVQDAASVNSKPKALPATSATGTRNTGTSAPWHPSGMYLRLCIASDRSGGYAGAASGFYIGGGIIEGDARAARMREASKRFVRSEER